MHHFSHLLSISSCLGGGRTLPGISCSRRNVTADGVATETRDARLHRNKKSIVHSN